MGDPGLLGSWLGIATDELLFLFFVFSPLFFLLGSSCFLSPHLPPPVLSCPPSPTLCPPICLFLAFLFVVSQLEVLHYRLNVSSALHSPAQPGLQALHAYQVLAFPSLPLPQGGRKSVCWYSATTVRVSQKSAVVLKGES